MEDLRKFPNLNIEQKVLLNWFYDRFNQPEGSPFHIDTVTELVYEGLIAGSEFLVYNANKLYICFDLNINFNSSAGATHGLINFFDEGNAANMYGQNNSITYEAVAAAIWYGKNNLNIKNLYFSRFVIATYNYMKFIGYRINY